MYALVNHLGRGCCTVEFVPCKPGKANLDWIATSWIAGCTGRLVLMNNSIVNNQPVRTDSDYQHVENTARCSKQKLNAATSKFTSFILAVTCFADMRDHVQLTKLGCTEESLRNMARCARQKLTTILSSVNPITLVKLGQALGEGKIASFLNGDPAPCR